MSKNEPIVIRDANISKIRVEVNKNLDRLKSQENYHSFMCLRKTPLEVPAVATVFGTTDSGEEVRIGAVEGFILNNAILSHYTEGQLLAYYDEIDQATYDVWEGVLSELPLAGHTLYMISPLTLYVGTDKLKKQSELASQVYALFVQEAEKATGIRISRLAGSLNTCAVIPCEKIIGSDNHSENWKNDSKWHWLTAFDVFMEFETNIIEKRYKYGYLETSQLSDYAPKERA